MACEGHGSSVVVVERRDRRRIGQLGWAWQGCVVCRGTGRELADDTPCAEAAE